MNDARVLLFLLLVLLGLHLAACRYETERDPHRETGTVRVCPEVDRCEYRERP